MLELLGGDMPDLVGGMAIGADPITAAILTLAGVEGLPLRGVMVRKEAKQHGTGKLVEGPFQPGESIVIVEDVVTTGGSSLLAIERCEAVGLKVKRVLAIIDRLEGGREAFAATGYELTTLFTIRDFGIGKSIVSVVRCRCQSNDADDHQLRLQLTTNSMETSLHRQLKERYATEGALIEQRVGRYRIDVVRGKQLVEIQHSSRSRRSATRSRRLLKKHDVLVVKPIVVTQAPGEAQAAKAVEIVSRRRSPKRRTLLDVFEELVHFTRVFPHRRLTLEVLLVEIEEWRYPGHGRRRWRRDNDHVVEDQHLVEVLEVHEFRTAADLCRLLPPELPQPFHTGQLAEGLGVERWIAQRMAYCLRETRRIRSKSASSAAPGSTNNRRGKAA